MRAVPTFLNDQLRASIKFNGVLYPANSVMQAAHACVAPAFFGNPEYPDTPISFLGSLVKIRHQERYFVLLTGHQCATHDPQWLLLEQITDRKWVSGHQVISAKVRKDSFDWVDLCLVEFTDVVKEGLLSHHGWLYLERSYSWDEIFSCFCVGYPSELNNIYENANTISLQRVVIQGNLLPKQLSSVRSFEPDTHLAYEPNGLSGGPVFYLASKSDELELIPGGITAYGSRNRINFIEPEAIKPFIRKLLENN